ncbi:hypothetical protein [Maribacter sp. ACAM166]|uniref:hypothetical protein n=1 Tax=Maribacter sp. ACAM166 TaxID=2508996 RepID=UPI0010FF0C04|nr:hypothetical protein [Maribacter sp. ACAM166]TLP70548.1 hypothetical protein ES765_20950 [Maribacter sp. ACAM166]
MRNVTIITLILLCFSCERDQEKILPQKTRLTSSVYASATIQPDSLYQIYSAVAGILDNNLTEEGNLVQKGGAILQIINRTSQPEFD